MPLATALASLLRSLPFFLTLCLSFLLIVSLPHRFPSFLTLFLLSFLSLTLVYPLSYISPPLGGVPRRSPRRTGGFLWVSGSIQGAHVYENAPTHTHTNTHTASQNSQIILTHSITLSILTSFLPLSPSLPGAHPIPCPALPCASAPFSGPGGACGDAGRFAATSGTANEVSHLSESRK